jgi:hypothetical protein
MHNVRAKINPVSGSLHLAHPLSKPEYGSIIGIDAVPDNVTPAEAVRQAERCAFFHAESTPFDAPTLVTWEQIADKPQGTIIRF